MKKQIKNKFHILLVGCSILYLSSCRSASDPLENTPEGTVTVKINSPIVGVNNNDKEYPVSQVQITPDNIAAAIEIERNVEYPKDEKLANGIHYKMVIYKKNGEQYTFQESKDFIAGNNQEIYLDKSKNYTLIIYSIGTNSAVPDLVNQKDFNNAYIDADYLNKKAKDLLYQRIDDFVPKDNSLPIKLERKISSIKFIIDVSDFYGGSNISSKVTELRDVRVIYFEYKKAKLNISNNEIAYEGADKVISDDLKFTSESNKEISEWNILRINSEKIRLNATILIDGFDDPGSYNFQIKNIKQGYSQTITLKPELCGIDINGVWRQFMCHNIGADYTADPFKPNKKLHGSRYQWGDAYHISENEDQNENDATISNDWTNHEEKKLEHPWGSDNSNPCPEGYRVPEKDELEELSKSEFRKIGSTSDIYLRGFELKDKEKGKLFIPAVGHRSMLGKVWNRGEMAGIWSGNEYHDTNAGNAYAFIINPNSEERIVSNIESQPKYYGYPVRCIKKLASE